MKKEKVDKLKKKNQEEDVKAQMGVLLYVMLIIKSLLFLLLLLLRLLFLVLLLSFVDRYKDANTYPGAPSSTEEDDSKMLKCATTATKRKATMQLPNRQLNRKTSRRRISIASNFWALNPNSQP